MSRFRITIAVLAGAFWATFAACQAMTPGMLSIKGGKDPGGEVSSPTSSDDELGSAASDAPDAFGKIPSSSALPSSDGDSPGSTISPRISKTPSGPGGDPLPISAPSSLPPPAPGGSADSASPTKSPMGPLASAYDPMNPKADLGDPLTGGDNPPATKKYFCSIYHVDPSGERVRAGVGHPAPPLAQPGLNTLQARFYAETMEAPLDCEVDSWWTYTPVKPGHYVQMLVYIKGVRYYQTVMATAVGPDGANVEFSGLPIKDGDEIGFSHLPLSDPPFPAPVLTLMSDEAWYDSGIDCDFGRFTVKTADVYSFRPQRAWIPRRIDTTPATK